MVSDEAYDTHMMASHPLDGLGELDDYLSKGWVNVDPGPVPPGSRITPVGFEACSSSFDIVDVSSYGSISSGIDTSPCMTERVEYPSPERVEPISPERVTHISPERVDHLSSERDTSSTTNTFSSPNSTSSCPRCHCRKRKHRRRKHGNYIPRVQKRLLGVVPWCELMGKLWEMPQKRAKRILDSLRLGCNGLFGYMSDDRCYPATGRCCSNHPILHYTDTGCEVIGTPHMFWKGFMNPSEEIQMDTFSDRLAHLVIRAKVCDR
ncbi:hypothetical protein F5Y15DRAFT_412339 [Xylariaceae sp. FL0016]|nr:hypothetical protein F5Y15DRAFT_412339 [Xylariaceae sp. FL0016]